MKPLNIGICLLALSAGAAFAQDDPPVDAAAAAPAADPVPNGTEADLEARAAEIDALEPGVPTQMLTADTGRGSDSGRVMDELDLGTTEVTGNQELPKVMYIVPWRESDPGDLMGRPANSLLEDVLAPIDRNEFVREVDYFHDLFDETGED